MALDFKHHHGGLSVPDIEASIRWWHDVLDFTVERRFDIAAIPAKVAMLRNGNLRIELFEVAGARPLPDERRKANTDLKTHGNKHVAFAVRNVDEFAQQLRERNVDIEFVGHFPHGDNIFIRDNAGNLVEFVQEPGLWTSGGSER
jgi:methylmalonyl-CoA/ethylmalonyl-CoA epimerase